MSLSRCEECETIEGKWLESKPGDLSLELVESFEPSVICGECGGVDCRQNIPEHDDMDMDR